MVTKKTSISDNQVGVMPVTRKLSEPLVPDVPITVMVDGNFLSPGPLTHFHY